MINRNITRVILDSTEVTDKTKSVSSKPLALAMTSSDYLYLGFKQPFTTRYFQFETPNTTALTLSAEFWNGQTWLSVEDFVDETSGFTQSGFISWMNMGRWMYSNQAPISPVYTYDSYAMDLKYYWLRLKTSGTLSAGTSLQSIVNLFCDDTLFSVYYPDLLSDSRYLPTNRSNFMEQYLAAKDYVVRRMRQMGKITDEGDILDVTDVAVAACHATAYIILNPIARDQESRDTANAALKACEAELARGTQTVDTNKDGVLEQAEKFSGTSFMKR